MHYISPMPGTWTLWPSHRNKASSVPKTQWGTFMLNQEVQLLRVEKQQFAAVWGDRAVPGSCTSCPESGCSHHCTRGSWQPTSLEVVFPPGVGSTKAACSPAAAGGSPSCSHTTNWGGKLPPCTPLAAAISATLLVGQHTAGTQSWRCFQPLLTLASAGGLQLPAAQLLVVKPFLGSSLPQPWYFTWIYPTTIPLVAG